MVLLFLSRLVWEKDLRVLADTYEQLRAKRDDFVMAVSYTHLTLPTSDLV